MWWIGRRYIFMIKKGIKSFTLMHSFDRFFSVKMMRNMENLLLFLYNLGNSKSKLRVFLIFYMLAKTDPSLPPPIKSNWIKIKALLSLFGLRKSNFLEPKRSSITQRIKTATKNTTEHEDIIMLFYVWYIFFKVGGTIISV